MNGSRVSLLAVLVDDYDPAIDFFVDALGFELVEDSPSLTNDGRPKRWVVVRPPGAETGILLARADGLPQGAVVGNQAAGRVGFFLQVDDFEEAHQRMVAAGVEFVTLPRSEPYGRVAVFLDVAGNRWDLIESLGRGAAGGRTVTSVAGTTGSYCIRMALPEDFLGIVRLHHEHEAPSVPLPEHGTDRQLATWDRMMATENLTVYVAESEGQIVGNTCMTVVPNLINQCRSTVFVEPMLVAAPHRRRGVGRLMVSRLLEDARAVGAYKVQLLSHKRHAHDGAHSFYASLGFTPEPEGFRLYLEDG